MQVLTAIFPGTFVCVSRNKRLKDLTFSIAGMYGFGTFVPVVRSSNSSFV